MATALGRDARLMETPRGLTERVGVSAGHHRLDSGNRMPGQVGRGAPGGAQKTFANVKIRATAPTEVSTLGLNIGVHLE